MGSKTIRAKLAVAKTCRKNAQASFMRGWRTNRLFEPSCMLHDIPPGLRIVGNILLVEQHLLHSLSGGMLSIIVYFTCESVAHTCCDFSTHDFCMSDVCRAQLFIAIYSLQLSPGHGRRQNRPSISKSETVEKKTVDATCGSETPTELAPHASASRGSHPYRRARAPM